VPASASAPPEAGEPQRGGPDPDGLEKAAADLGASRSSEAEPGVPDAGPSSQAPGEGPDASATNSAASPSASRAGDASPSRTADSTVSWAAPPPPIAPPDQAVAEGSAVAGQGSLTFGAPVGAGRTEVPSAPAGEVRSH